MRENVRTQVKCVTDCWWRKYSSAVLRMNKAHHLNKLIADSRTGNWTAWSDEANKLGLWQRKLEDYAI